MNNAQGVVRSGVSRMSSSFRKLGAAVKSAMGPLIALAAAYAGIRTIGRMLTLAGEAEAASVAINVVLKDMNKTKKLLKEMDRFSVTTPFEPTEVRAAGKAMLAFRHDVEDVPRFLKMLGDATAGSGASLSEVVQIFNKVKAQGRLTGETFEQFAERGINMQAELADMLGKTTEEIVDMQAKGELKFPLIVKAFQRMTSEGGMFFGAMEKQSTTWQGRLSTLTGNIKLLGEKIGTELFAAAKPVLESLIELTDALSNNGKLIGISFESSANMIRTAFSSLTTDMQTDWNTAIEKMSLRIVDWSKTVSTAFSDAKHGITELLIATNREKTKADVMGSGKTMGAVGTYLDALTLGSYTGAKVLAAKVSGMTPENQLELAKKKLWEARKKKEERENLPPLVFKSGPVVEMRRMQDKALDEEIETHRKRVFELTGIVHKTKGLNEELSKAETSRLQARQKIADMARKAEDDITEAKAERERVARQEEAMAWADEQREKSKSRQQARQDAATQYRLEGAQMFGKFVEEAKSKREAMQLVVGGAQSGLQKGLASVFGKFGVGGLVGEGGTLRGKRVFKKGEKPEDAVAAKFERFGFASLQAKAQEAIMGANLEKQTADNTKQTADATQLTADNTAQMITGLSNIGKAIADAWKPAIATI